MSFASPTDPNVSSLLQTQSEAEIAKFLGQTLLAAVDAFETGGQNSSGAAPRWPQQPKQQPQSLLQQRPQPQQFAQRGKPSFGGAQPLRGTSNFRAPRSNFGASAPRAAQPSQFNFGQKRAFDANNGSNANLFTRRDDDGYSPPARRGRF